DEVTDHDVAPRIRLELVEHDLGRLRILESSARVREVRKRRKPERRPQLVETVRRDPAKLTARLVLHAPLREHHYETGPPRPVAGGRGEEAHRGSELCEPALLPPNAEHLDAVHARGVATREESAQIRRPRRRRLRPRELAVAECERGRVVLGDVETERL